jgi:hypothetical protein
VSEAPGMGMERRHGYARVRGLHMERRHGYARVRGLHMERRHGYARVMGLHAMGHGCLSTNTIKQQLEMTVAGS